MPNEEFVEHIRRYYGNRFRDINWGSVYVDPFEEEDEEITDWQSVIEG